MATYFWFVQLQTFNDRLLTIMDSGWGASSMDHAWTALINAETQLMIRAWTLVHAYVATVAALVGEITAIYVCDTYSYLWWGLTLASYLPGLAYGR